MSADLAAREKLRQTVRRSRLFDPGERVLVAVSGGIDSVVLLHLVRHLPEALRPRVVAAHFHHGLRGRSADADRKFVRNLCASWTIPFRTAKAPRWRERRNIESRARELRYRFLESVARRLKIRKILTAHHADDQLETFVLRWIQGAGLRGLAGIRMRRPFGRGADGREALERIRPLLDVTRAEIETYARFFGLVHREDETNRSGVFLRSRVRGFLKKLKKENPNLAARTAVNALFLQADDRYLEERAEDVYCEFARRSSGRIMFPLPRYRSLPEALRFRLLQKMAQGLREAAFALPAVAILKADEILRDSSKSARLDLPSRLTLQKNGQGFVFSRKSSKNRIDSRGCAC